MFELPFFDSLVETPVGFLYDPLTTEAVLNLRQGSRIAELKAGPQIELFNAYHRLGIEGTQARMFARQAVAERLQRMRQALPAEYGMRIFDLFRSRATQLAIFEKIQNEVQNAHPDWNSDRVLAETKIFAAHPDDAAFAVPPHNSGGAIDLTLTFDGVPLDMGTSFDVPSPRSATAFFEAPYSNKSKMSKVHWLLIRRNRRILFNVMKAAGFTNYREEWWHYDLGDCLWAAELGTEWSYPSLEPEVITMTRYTIPPLRQNSKIADKDIGGECVRKRSKRDGLEDQVL